MNAAENDSYRPIVANEDPIRWRPLTLSFLAHAVILVACLLILSRFTQTVGGEPDRVGQIVLAISSDNSEVEYLDKEDFDSETKSAEKAEDLVTDFTDLTSPGFRIDPTFEIKLITKA